jgi:hypothetical protein
MPIIHLVSSHYHSHHASLLALLVHSRPEAGSAEGGVLDAAHHLVVTHGGGLADDVVGPATVHGLLLLDAL